MSKRLLSQQPLNFSQSRSIQELISIKIPCESETDLNDTVDSSDSLCENDGEVTSETKTVRYIDTNHFSGNPITHGAEVNPVPASNPQTPLTFGTPSAPHSLSVVRSAAPGSNHLPSEKLSLNLFPTIPEEGGEKAAQTSSVQAWPPLMLRHITVNNVPYYAAGELGRGATSVVHRVLDMDFKLYALKSVNLDEADQLTLDCYRNEIQILRDLKDHSHLIHMLDYEYCAASRSLLVVMEYGHLDLAKIIKANDNKPFSVWKIQHYWHDMLQGVTAIHAMGIVHSDLKPNNFVIVDTNLKLIDFGIAYSLNQDATSFEREGRWGTPNYMAPEMIMTIPKSNSIPSQPDVCKISQAADIWSLGCILYKLTYGVTPFQHITDKIKKWIAISDPNERIAFNEEIPSSLLQALVSCLDRNPRRRPTGLQLLSQKFLTNF